MPNSLSRRGALLGLGATALIGAAPAAFAAEGTRRFAIIRKGDEIGEHTLSFTRRGDVEEMRIRILIEIRLLGVRVFVYDHTNTETWRAGKLERIDTRTNDDGDRDFCRARRVGDELQVEGSEYTGVLSGDHAPTSYWRKSGLPWFSSQSGKPLALTLSRSAIGGGGERYAVRGDFDVTLEYDAVGEWRGCGFSGRDGEPITYRETTSGPSFNG